MSKKREPGEWLQNFIKREESFMMKFKIKIVWSGTTIQVFSDKVPVQVLVRKDSYELIGEEPASPKFMEAIHRLVRAYAEGEPTVKVPAHPKHGAGKPLRQGRGAAKKGQGAAYSQARKVNTKLDPAGIQLLAGSHPEPGELIPRTNQPAEPGPAPGIYGRASTLL